MSEKVFKYQLSLGTHVLVPMHKGAELLTVQTQGRDHIQKICLWARIDTDQRMVMRQIDIHGTGYTIIELNKPYIGTVQLEDGRLVFHFFDAGEVKGGSAPCGAP